MFYHHKTCRGLWQALWPPDAKSWLIGKDPDAGEDWGQEEKGMAEDEMVGWHHWLNGHEFEQTLEDSVGPGSLVYCCPWGHKSLTWLGNWTRTTKRERNAYFCRRVGRSYQELLNEKWRDFLGGLVVETLHFHCHSPGSTSTQATGIP